MFSKILWLFVSDGIQVQRQEQGMSLLLWIQGQMKNQIVPKTLNGVKKEILLTLYFLPPRLGTDIKWFVGTAEEIWESFRQQFFFFVLFFFSP